MWKVFNNNANDLQAFLDYAVKQPGIINQINSRSNDMRFLTEQKNLFIAADAADGAKALEIDG